MAKGDERVDKSEGNIYSRKDVLMVLTTSPAGLGHVRVMEALRHGLPAASRVEVLGLSNPKFQALHRIASRNRSLRAMMEFIQNNPVAEGRFSRIYSNYLRRNADEVYFRLREVIRRPNPQPKIVVLLCTHFSMAHQLAQVKEKLGQELKACVVLAVVVTDDSPQKVWGVIGADYIFVPSGMTKDKLLEYMHSVGGKIPEIFVVPYPVSPDFCRLFSEVEFKNKKLTVRENGKTALRLMVPVSGGAVQLSYLKDLIGEVLRKGGSEVMVVARESRQTRKFLRWCGSQDHVDVVARSYDPEVVGVYEKQYMEKVVSLEVTKPSEQTFKVLLNPEQRGGVIMCFSKPVGRQENDNLAFCRRHGLLPEKNDQEVINQLIRKGKVGAVDKAFLERARKWRAVLLPRFDGKAAGRGIAAMRRGGILAAMMSFSEYMDHDELSCHGVDLLWARLAVEIKKKCAL